MANWRSSPQKILVVIGLLLGFALLPTLSGCVTGSVAPINRVLQAVGDLQPLPKKVEQEYQRFADALRGHTVGGEEVDDQLKYFRFAFKRIRTSYVRPVDDAKLIDAAIKGMDEADVNMKGAPSSLVEAALDAVTKSLDPHSGFMNGQEFNESFVHTKGEFGGLGIEVTMQDGLVKVVAPIEDTPAARAGMQSGDLIVEVDGEPIKGVSLAQAVRRMRGLPGEAIDLLVRREGLSDFKVQIIRAIIKVRAVRWQTIGNFAYIRVSRFSERVQSGIAKAFVDIRDELGAVPTGVVLDLRNNPGGLLDQSVVLADAFLDDGAIVSVRGRSKSNNRSFLATEGDLAAGIPIIVLVNGGSASASEIVASALKHHNRAIVMGTQTFGKGSVQTIIPMPREGALRLTTALYYGADGYTIQARGVLPDILIEPKKASVSLGRRESDLPGAIPAEKGVLEKATTPKIFVKNCPAADVSPRAGRQRKKDRMLGCALAYLATGSKEKFLAVHGVQRQM